MHIHQKIKRKKISIVEQSVCNLLLTQKTSISAIHYFFPLTFLTWLNRHICLLADLSTPYIQGSSVINNFLYSWNVPVFLWEFGWFQLNLSSSRDSVMGTVELYSLIFRSLMIFHRVQLKQRLKFWPISKIYSFSSTQVWDILFTMFFWPPQKINLFEIILNISHISLYFSFSELLV